MAVSVYSQIKSNTNKTWLIMGFFCAFVALVAFLFGKASGSGLSWAGIALMISGVSSFFGYYYSDHLVLSLSGAHPADRKTDFDLFTVTENIALASGIATPAIYVIEDPSPNAFATGRDPKHAAVCATRGLLQRLNRRELEGVIAHELSHITNYDTRLMAVVTVFVGAIAYLSDWFSRNLWWGGYRSHRRESDRGGELLFVVGLVLALLSPLIATLIQLAISRRREFLADAAGVLLTHNPDALADALEKISDDKRVLSTATNATAHLFIVNPFKGKEFTAWFANLFNTHPPVAQRIKILRSM